ncbi:hypothetical protein [Candidatus Avelusimicrobium caledoniensis]|uniref:hypothetical protein n=1 Tax=Candidatus Avelusimicrobium caledoniensis TaxID=3416220 RepID=UPI003D14E22C
MALENNPSNGQGDIAQFLEKFQDPNLNTFNFTPSSQREKAPSDPSNQYARSFEKLEQKVQELEEKFDASERQNEKILSELAHTREHIERQRDRESFLDHLSFSIANLRASVENLTRAQQERTPVWREPDIQRSFDVAPRPTTHAPIDQYEPDAYRQAQERKHQAEQAEKERIISSLHQKASQLKAVNSALDREIKKVQQEKMDALKKSAEQAKEILSLRNQLSQAEARFKSFDFEGRIISIRQAYEQRVNSLETQLKEISETCMKQVEEIETLRAENIKLHEVAAEKEQLLAQLAEKEKELQSLRDEMAALQENNTLQSQNQQAIYAETVRSLESQRDELTVQLQATQNELDAVRGEKDQLEKNFKILLEKINSNDAVIEELKGKIEVLGEQNQQLAAQNQQLSAQNEQLAARQTHLEQQITKTPQPPAAPVVAKASKRVYGSLKPVKPSVQPAAPVQAAQAAQPVQAAAPAASKPAPVREARVDTPVEITQEAKPKVQTEADLPEIKVAPAQDDPDLSEGEDFLEKTDNFLGRIKWSIFNEDR